MTAPAFDWRIWRALAVAFLALKLVLLVAARPFMDETYYWLWGQHLALSYFDHPPLVGWTQALAPAGAMDTVAGLLSTPLTDTWKETAHPVGTLAGRVKLI